MDRRRNVRWIAGLLLVLSGCSGEEDATVEVAAEPGETAVGSVAVDAPEPQHGGTVVMAEGYPVEVVAHRSGQVYAYLLQDEAPASDRVVLTVSVPTAGRSTPRPVRMVWAPGDLRWHGRVRRLEIVPGPIDVVFEVDGDPYRGHVEVITVAPAIEVHVIEPTVEIRRGKHKHKHRGRGHGWGHGHGHGGRGRVDIRFR